MFWYVAQCSLISSNFTPLPSRKRKRSQDRRKNIAMPSPRPARLYKIHTTFSAVDSAEPGVETSYQLHCPEFEPRWKARRSVSVQIRSEVHPASRTMGLFAIISLYSIN